MSEQKHSFARADTYNYVIDGFAEQQDQLHALATSLLYQLAPEDPKNPEVGCNMVAWRLAQIMQDMLSGTEQLESSRRMLLDGWQGA